MPFSQSAVKSIIKLVSKSDVSVKTLSGISEDGFAKLNSKSTSLIFDMGMPNKDTQNWHAGTLSFEFSHGKNLILVNNGFLDIDSKWANALRGTSAHSTISIDGKKLSPAEILSELNRIGGENGVGRLDFVENRSVGMKSRGIYETPGGTILLEAHRGIEQITLDREACHLKDEIMPKYAELIYNGYWFSSERRMLQKLIDESQKNVSGEVRIKIYKGSAVVVGRSSEQSLYSLEHVTFEEDSVYDQTDAEGFIKINALRLRLSKKD